jgi:long-chain fatty acid transport protein
LNGYRDLSESTPVRQAAVLIALTIGSALPITADTGPALTGVAAVGDSAQVVYLNPAGLTRLTEQELEFQFMAGYGESDFRFTSSSLPGERVDKSDGSAVIPSLYYARPVNQKWAWGASISIPGGLGTSFDDDWAGRYFLQEWYLVYVGLTGGVGYRLNDKVSFGGALTVNYAKFGQESAVLNVDAGFGDGKMELVADDFVLSYTFGTLFEPCASTRFGIVYRSETEPDLKGVPDFSGLGPTREMQLQSSGALDRAIGIDATLPRSLIAGMFHEFPGGNALTIDLIWLDFSQFGFSTASAGDTSIVEQSTDYEDIFAASAGLRFPIKPGWEMQVGGLYLSEPVKDENRSLALRLDRIFGVGGGIRRTVNERHGFSLNLTYFDLGDAPVQTGDLPLVGTLRGEFDTHHAVLLDFTYRWRF